VLQGLGPHRSFTLTNLSTNYRKDFKCVYLALMSLDPTGTARQCWSNRWKAALNAFSVAFPGRVLTTSK